VEPGQELLQKWDERRGRFHPRMEITSEGLMLGVGTVLAKMAQDESGRSRLVLDDEPRAIALLATAYEQPVEPHVLRKVQRACELWNADEKALAYIHLAHVNLPPCDEEQALRLIVADELIESGVTPAGLMKAQGLDLAPLALLKFNPDQLRVPAGNGRESGEWTDGEANITTVAFRSRRERGGHRRRGGGFDPIHSFLEWLRQRGRSNETEPAPEAKPHSERDNAGTSVKPFGSLESDLPRPGYGEEVPIPGLPDNIKGIDTTDSGAGMANYKTDLTRPEFESQLSQLGWTKEPSKDGEAMIYTKDGAKYSVRDNAKSTGEPTAEFSHPLSTSGARQSK
jgi:hypothetical protein